MNIFLLGQKYELLFDLDKNMMIKKKFEYEGEDVKKQGKSGKFSLILWGKKASFLRNGDWQKYHILGNIYNPVLLSLLVDRNIEVYTWLVSGLISVHTLQRKYLYLYKSIVRRSGVLK